MQQRALGHSKQTPAEQCRGQTSALAPSCSHGRESSHWCWTLWQAPTQSNKGKTAAEQNQKDANFDTGFPEHSSCSSLVHWTVFLDSLQAVTGPSFERPSSGRAGADVEWLQCLLLPSTRQVHQFHKITLMPLIEHLWKESLLGLWSLLLRNEGLAQKLAGEFIHSHMEAK